MIFLKKLKDENDPNKIIGDVINKYLKKSDEFYERAKNYINDMKYHIEQRQTINIIFNASEPKYSSNLILKFGTTIEYMIKFYLKLNDKRNLINDNRNEINFFWNKFKLGLKDKTPIEIFFKNNLNPEVNVYLNNSNILDNNNKKNYNKLNIKEEEDILIMKYFNQIFEEKSKSKGKINKSNNINIKIDYDILNKYLKKCKEFYENLYNTILDMKFLVGSAGPKINVIFATTYLTNTTLALNYGVTIAQMLKIYLRRFYRESLINNKKCKDRIIFLYNGKKLRLEDKTSVYLYFGNDSPQVVVVHEASDSFCLDNLRIEDYKLSKEEINLIDLYNKQIREEKIYVPRAEQESFPLPSRPSREINIKFNDGVNVVNIKMDDSYMVAELINEYFEKTKEKNRTFIFNNEELSPMDASPLYEVGLKNNSVIFVQ